MKRMGFEVKFLVLFLLLGASMFVFLLIYKNHMNSKLKEESFKSYEYYNFSNNISSISKTNLVNDPYLTSLLRIEKYMGIDENNMEEIMKYFLLNITKNASKDISIRDGELSFCMNETDFVKSFKEFFDYDITEHFEYLNNISFVKHSLDTVCFNLEEEVLYDYYTLIGVKSIGTNGEIISAEIYLYDLDLETPEEEEFFKNSLIDSINRNNLESFNKTVPYYEKKSIMFKEIPDGDFFKYQVLQVLTE